MHTAALIELMGGQSVTEEYRRRSFAVNVDGTKNLVHAAQKARRQAVRLHGEQQRGDRRSRRSPVATRRLPYTDRFADLYTETKVVAEKFVLSQNGVGGLLTCSIRPSGIWGRGDQTMFRKVFERVVTGQVKVLIGSKHARLDNSYVHNLVHGFILAAQHLVEGGTAPGQAYFINDDDPVNMFEFARPVVEACGANWPHAQGVGSIHPFRDDRLAVAALPVQSGCPTPGTACGGTALPR